MVESVDECRDFTNIEFGDVEPASIEAVRAVYPDAEEPADSERWVQIAVAGDWNGITQAWVQYNISFTLLTPSGETFWQPRGQPENVADDVERIDAYQYYLVRGDEDDLVLACSTIDGDFPLRNTKVSPEN